jgi:Winged helix-turn helix
MGAAVAVTRSGLTPAQLRSAACASEEPAQVRRLLAIALVLEGMPRRQAAEQCGMDRQTLRDWVHRYDWVRRYDEGGVAGLRSRPSPGRAPLPTPEQKAELRAGPWWWRGPTRSGTRWRGGAASIRAPRSHAGSGSRCARARSASGCTSSA